MSNAQHSSPTRILRWSAGEKDPVLTASLDTFARWSETQANTWYAERWPIIAGRLYGEPGDVTEIPDSRAEAIAIGTFGVVALRRARANDTAQQIREDNDQLAAELLGLFQGCPGVYRRRRVALPLRIAACGARTRSHDHEHAAGEHLDPQVLKSWEPTPEDVVPEETQRACRKRLLPRTEWRYQHEAPPAQRHRLLQLALGTIPNQGTEPELHLKAIALRALIQAIVPGQGLHTVTLPPDLSPQSRKEAARHARLFAEIHCNQTPLVT